MHAARKQTCTCSDALQAGSQLSAYGADRRLHVRIRRTKQLSQRMLDLVRPLSVRRSASAGPQSARDGQHTPSSARRGRRSRSCKLPASLHSSGVPDILLGDHRSCSLDCLAALTLWLAYPA